MKEHAQRAINLHYQIWKLDKVNPDSDYDNLLTNNFPGLIIVYNGELDEWQIIDPPKS